MRQRSVSPRVGILGAGYMGLVTGLAFAHRGRRVVAFDSNPRVLRAIRHGKSPYREAGLDQLLGSETRFRRFRVVESVKELVDRSDVVFVCLPTPRGPEGRIDLRPMLKGLRSLGEPLRHARGYRLVVIKSTVVPGTTSEVLEPTLRRWSRKPRRELGVANNPEFLAEGSMVHDALHPERVVLGVSDARAARLLRRLYVPFRCPVFALSPAGAELVKYASNAFLAIKVSFANEVGRLSELAGENIDRVMDAVGADRRIGPRFLRAGPGFGGSCFDKDLRAIIARADELGVRFATAESALRANEDQVGHVLRLIRTSAKSLRGRSVAVLGVSFKAGTDDVRESRAFPIVRGLIGRGARVRLHDPVALSNFAREWRRGGWGKASDLTLCRSPGEALRGADLAVLHSDWPEYRSWSNRWTDSMRTPTLVDLRRWVPASRASDSGLRVVALGVGQSPVARRPRTAASSRPKKERP